MRKLKIDVLVAVGGDLAGTVPDCDIDSLILLLAYGRSNQTEDGTGFFAMFAEVMDGGFWV